MKVLAVRHNDTVTDARTHLRRWAIPAAVGAGVAIAYTIFSAWQWSTVPSMSWDLSIFTQLLQRYAALQVPIVPVRGPELNLLGDHFHPLLALLAPIYALFPSAFTLIVIQNVCFGIAAAIITRGALLVFGPHRPVQAVLFGLAFGFTWGLQSAVEQQFHEIALAVPLLAASLVSFVAARPLQAALWAAPLVFVKEDLGLTVIAISVVLVIRTRKPVFLWLAVWGAGWFLIATYVVLPLLSGGEWGYSDSLNIFEDPSGLFDPRKGHTLLLLLAVTAVVGIRSPLILVLLPTLAWRFLSTNHGYWGPTWHYSAVLMPIAFIAVLDGIRIVRRSPFRQWRDYGRSAGWVTIAVSAVLLPTLPLWALVDGRAAQEHPRAAVAERVVASIPDGAMVETDVGLMNYVVSAHPTYWIGWENPVPDCILIDTVAGGLPEEWGDVTQVAQIKHPDVVFEVLFSEDGYELACRP